MKKLLLFCCLLPCLNAFAQPLNGTYTIGGLTADYLTIQFAVDDLKAKGISGPVVFDINPNIYPERISVPEIDGASATNTITFQSASGKAEDVTITSAGGGTPGNHYTFQLNGADHVILNELTVQNLGQTWASGIQLLHSANYNKITNCIIKIDTANNSSKKAGILAADSGLYLCDLCVPDFFIIGGFVPDNASYTEVSNNIIEGSGIGIFFSGSSALMDKRNVIKNNTLINIYYSGMLSVGNDSLVVQGNRFDMSINSLSSQGIYMSQVENFLIDGNYLSGCRNNGMLFILTYKGVLSNNMVGGGFTLAYGTAIFMSVTGEMDFYNNSIIFDAPPQTQSPTEPLNHQPSSVIHMISDDGNGMFEKYKRHRFKNNNFYNKTGGLVYYVERDDDGYGLVGSDYNNLYTSGDTVASIRSVKLTSIYSLRSVFAFDSNSVSVDPGFASDFDLHCSSPVLDGRGTVIPGVTKDIDKETRSTRYPDIGADEYELPHPAYDIAIHTIYPKVFKKGNNAISIILINKGSVSLVDSAISLSYSTDGGTTWTNPELLKITALDILNAQEQYSFTTPWNVQQGGTYNVCVRINAPGIPSDLNKTNDKLCESICVPLTERTYTIGSNNADFPSLTAAVALLKGHACGISGPIVFNIQPGTYIGSVAIPLINGVSSTNTITFQSETGNPEDVIIINTAGELYTIDLLSARYITFRNVTVQIEGQTNTNYTQAAPAIQFRGEGFYNKVSGCIVKAPLVTGTTFGTNFCPIRFMGSTFVTRGETGTVIENNRIDGGGIGIELSGNSFNPDIGNKVIGNTITNSFSSGITIYASDSLTLADNVSSKVFTIFQAGKSRIYNNQTPEGYQFFRIDSSLIYNNRGNATMSIVTGKFNTIAHNSIHALPNPLVSSSSVTAFQLGYGSLKNEVYNNIFYSETGYAFSVEDPASIIKSDHNNLYVPAGKNLGYWKGSVALTLADWQTLSAFDMNSISTDPQFSSVTDFHTVNPQLDKKAFLIPDITHDMDGQPRDPYQPDIGADEFVLDQYDIAVTDIEPKTAKYGSNTVKATLTNLGLKSLVDSIVSLSYSTDGGQTWSAPEVFIPTVLSANQLSEQYAFTQPWQLSVYKNYTLKVRINQPGLFSDKVRVNDSLQITVCAPIAAGAYTVGIPSADFPNLDAVYTSLNGPCGIEGPVVFSLEPGVYEQNLVIGAIKGCSAINTITFQSKTGQAEDVVIRAGDDAYAVGTVLLAGAHDVSIRNMTIENPGTELAAGVMLCCGAEYNEVSGCVIRMDTVTYTSEVYGVIISDTLGFLNETSAGNNVIRNNTITGGNAGIRLIGGLTSANIQNVIENNSIERPFHTGIIVSKNDNTVISNNKIQVHYLDSSATGLDVDKSNQCTIAGNYVSGAGGTGISITNAEHPFVANNMIAGGFSTLATGYGILLKKVSEPELYYNSVLYDAAQSNASAALCLKGNRNVRLINNILANTSGGLAYDIDSLNTIDASNYNDLYANGSKLAFLEGNRTALSDLQTLGVEMNSISTDPLFIAAGNLHTFNTLLDGKGVPITAVTLDYDNQARNTSAPDIGCDEFMIGTDAALKSWINPSTGALNAGDPQLMKVNLANAGSTMIGNFQVSYTVNGGMPVTETFTGTLSVGTSTGFEFSAPWTPQDTGTYVLCAKTQLAGDMNALNDENCITVKVSSPTGIHDASFSGLLIYPNPATDMLTISLGKALPEARLIIRDATGRVLADRPFSSAMLSVDVSSYAKGVYLVQLTDKSGIITRKLILR